MSEFIDNDDDHQGSGGGGFQFEDLDADAAIARMIAEEIGGAEEPEVRAPDKVRRERLMGGVEATFCSSFGRAKKVDPDVSADIDPTLFNPIDRDPDLEKAMEESRLLYEVEQNLRGDADPDFEKAIAESIHAQIKHEEEVTKVALEEERTKRATECDLLLRRLKVMFGGKPEILSRVDALFRTYIECATGQYLYLSPEDHLFFGDLMDYLYTLPLKLMGRSILSKELFERLSKHMVIRDGDISAEDQFFMRTQWAEGTEKSILQERWTILKSFFE